ncbi:MAG: TonB-dependent receptor [Salinibacter sp.]
MMRRPRYSAFASLLFAVLLTFTAVNVHAQSTGVVEGRVVDASGGVPLPGANVVVDGTNIGTSTNQNGQFRLDGVPAGSQTLTVSFVSYQSTSKTVEVEAGQATTVNVELSSQVVEGEEVVVTGLREGQVRSVNQKKQAMMVMDALSADAIGKLPDQNVAEALQRLPGISIKTDRGEGRFVRIRGTSADLNNVSLNGQTMASSAGSRATALDLVPSNMISSIEVIKAVTPDMDANAVGGTVNINTLTAFDRSGTFGNASVQYLSQPRVMNIGNSSMKYRANATFGTKFGSSDQFGIVGSFSASRRDFAVSIVDPDEWRQDSNLKNNKTSGNRSYAYPNELETQAEDNERERYGGNLSLDWRPSDQTSLYLRGFVTQRNEVLQNNESELTFEPEGDPIQTSPTTGRFPRGSVELDIARNDQEDNLYSFSLGGDQELGDFVLNFDGTYTRGESDVTRFDHTWETPGGGNGDPRASASYDTRPFFFAAIPKNPSYVSNPANYKLRSIQTESRQVRENTYVASTDLKWKTSLAGAPGYVKVGGKFTSRDKVVDQEQIEFDTTNTARAPTLEPFALGNIPVAAQANSSIFTLGDVSKVARWTQRNIRSRSDFNSNLLDLDEEATAEEAVEADSDNSEQIYAGYGMADFTVGALNVLGGVRIEHTTTDVKRFQIRDDENFSREEDVTSETTSNNYTNVLPSLHLRYEATSDLLFRASWSNTIGRPDYDLLAQFESVSTQGTAQINISRGNPNLEPFRASSFDVTAEYYLGGGLISVGGFYKHIDNPIYTDTETIQNFTYQGTTYDEAEITQTTNVNAGTLLGVEGTADVLFTFLPSPLDGIGVRSNVAYIDSEVDVPGRGELPFFGQSDLVANATPYFQKWGFQARVALSYQSEALTDIGDKPFEDEYNADRTTWDASVSYEVNNLLSTNPVTVFARVRNITNESERTYQGVEGRYARDEVYGRTFTFGATTSF